MNVAGAVSVDISGCGGGTPKEFFPGENLYGRSIKTHRRTVKDQHLARPSRDAGRRHEKVREAIAVHITGAGEAKPEATPLGTTFDSE